MKFTKYDVQINVEVLDLDSVGALVMQAVRNLGNHHKGYSVQMRDGDSIKVIVRETEHEV